MEQIKEYPHNTNYKVSSYGYIIGKKGKHITGSPDKNGYMRTSLTDDNGNVQIKYIHRMILETFAPTANMDALTVNHIDGNTANNNLSNLEWNNMKQQIENRETRMSSQAIYSFNPDTKEKIIFVNQSECARYYNVKQQNINYYLSRVPGKIWKKHNLQFFYCK